MVPMKSVSAQSLLQVAQRAADLEASVAFYRDVLGGRILGQFDPPGIAFVEVGGVRLLLDDDSPAATLYFRVDNLDEAYQTLRQQNVAFEAEPALVHRDDAGQFGAAGEEEWMAFLRDPSGNLLGLVERRRPSV
jgi:catechol 2,3-dioxygenase-like lactoylglutathione lyase family enzyme